MARGDRNGRKASRGECAGACELKLRPRIDAWCNAIEKARQLDVRSTPEDREAAECNVCLTSRSAYLDFYTWVVINGEIDPWAESSLRDLFKVSLEVMSDSKYRNSVALRRDEFAEVCRRVKKGLSAGAVSSFSDSPQ